MLEATYQRSLVKKLRDMFPGCEILINDPARVQGVCDLLILYFGMWAMLEVKASATASDRPNQPHYVEQYNNMSFAAFIYPENEEQVLRDLQSAFGAARAPRVPKSEQLPLDQLRRTETGGQVPRLHGRSARKRSSSSRS